MPVIDGQRATAGNDGVLAARKVKDVHNRLMYLEPMKNPLALLTRKASSKSVHNPAFDVQEVERIPSTDRVNNGAGYTASATSIVVDNGAYFLPNSIVEVQRTGETMLCTAVSTNTLTVTRSFGTTAAAALVDNDQLTIIGPAALEGAAIETSKTVQATEYTNYTQIFRWPFALTGTLMATQTYGEQDHATQRRMAAIHHAVNIELSGFFGEKAEVTSGDTARRASDGLLSRISTNSTDFGGSFNWNTFSSASEGAFRYGSGKKTAFVSRGAASQIDQEAMTKVERVQSDATFGLRTAMLRTTHGELMLITHNELTGDEHGGKIFVVDMANVGYRFLRGRDTQLRIDVGTPGTDAQTDEYLTECGWFLALEKTHAVFTNVA